MGRKTHLDKVLRIRFRDDSGIPKTSLVISSNAKSARANFSNGKVLRVGKYRSEEIYKVGEFNTLADRLMREFSQDEQARRRHGEFNGVESGYDRIKKDRLRQEGEA